MKIVVIGVGAVGGYFGGRLAQKGNHVTFVARGENYRAIRENGIEIRSPKGDAKILNVQVVESIAQAGVADVVLLGVKAWQVSEVAPQLASILHNQSTVIPLQNGVLAVEELTESLNAGNVLGGLCRIFSKMEAHGVVNHFDAEPTIIFGETDNQKTDRVLRLKQLFEDAGVKAVVPDDVETEAWKKFLFICSSGLLAVARATYGEIRELPQTRLLLQQLFEEIYRLALAKGVRLDEQIVERTLQSIDTFAYNATSSLTRDVMEGRPSEIEYQNGAVVRLARGLGVATPINDYVYSTILPMEKRSRKG